MLWAAFLCELCQKLTDFGQKNPACSQNVVEWFAKQGCDSVFGVSKTQISILYWGKRSDRIFEQPNGIRRNCRS